MAIPLSTIGSFGPAFAPARLVGLAVNPASSHTLERTIANRAEPSFALLRYSLGGNRPSQTDPHALSPAWLTGVGVRILMSEEWCFTLRLQEHRSTPFKVSHLRYASQTRTQYELTVKVHRVFPSYCGQAASSPPLQFRRDPLRDSRSVVTRFVQVGTYPTRNFATLGPL